MAWFVAWPTFGAKPLVPTQKRASLLLAVGLVHLVLGLVVLVQLWLVSRIAGPLPRPIMAPDTLAASPLAFLVFAPLLEEPLFRGWLTGRLAALRFAVFGFTAMALMLAGLLLVPDHARALGWAGAAVALAGLVQWSLTRERRHAREVPHAFIRHFGWIAWGQAALFGLIHLGNYEPLTSPWGLVVVLPQVLGGILLGYIRTRAGLVAAIAYHAAFNAVWLLVAQAMSWAVRP